MPFLPQLQEVATDRETLQEFRGYNHNLQIADSEFFDMQNMTGDQYPVLTPRKSYGRVRQLTKPNGLYAHEKLCWVDGEDFYYDGKKRGTVEDSKKQLIGMGAYIVIFPDKMMYNTATDELTSLAARRVTVGTTATTLALLDGSDMGKYTTSGNPPTSPSNGDLWLDSSAVPNVLKRYTSTSDMWVSIPTTYVKISASGIGKGFKAYDGVTITGMVDKSLNGEYLLYAAADDYIVVQAIVKHAQTQTAAVTVERKIPDMDFITESENRLWGCSSSDHEIRACKLGDPCNWSSFLGTAADSYAMTVGSPSKFTGCCTHLGYVLFFKEDVIHKIYGNKPANYQLTNTNARGVQEGSDSSLVRVNETLLYKSKKDICAMASALPESLSKPLGDVSYKSAAAGAHGSKYYVSMQTSTGEYRLFVYNTETGMWHREGNLHIEHFAELGNDLYFIDEADRCLYSVAGNITDYADNEAMLEPPIDWFFESGDIGMELADRKYISKFMLRMEVDEGALVHMDVKYDDTGDWKQIYRLTYKKKRSITIPFIPHRCDTLRIRFHGTGGFRLYTLTKVLEQGSDV